ncbi:MAG: 50S ribosomal protein L9 [Saccharofermentanaceae bacterium]|jgi:large subunit ribosomal protein L9|nr:50S ribosomal protein L9 [Clostridia bacterium]NLX69121.1 50S ribosomal protein L9 [Clostridiaceae bacterium]HOO49016.1 50S ribosomal protein L9 [Saccharofermentans sp.]HPE28318.1 50S ribosomal protein L9 [Saccharofermentans sp.]HPG65021.1 50S ribosomal protein L9 [Saccharofermentans sp.]
MKLILLADVKGLGKANDLVDVNDGYGRNYLLKQKLAKESTASNLNDVKLKMGAAEERARRELEAAKELSSKLGGSKFTYQVKCGEGGKLYGAVTTMDIAQVLKQNGYDIPKKNIVIDGAIKSVGTFSVRIKLHPEVSCKISLEVVS